MNVTPQQLELIARRYCELMQMDPEKLAGKGRDRCPFWQTLAPSILSNIAMTIATSSVLESNTPSDS